MDNRNVIRELWQGIRRIFEPLLREWDGSASNYDSTDAYCSACLIDVNAADRDEKAQSHCMLPVKSPGSDSYNQEGVHAAAGRFGQVEKPEDVDQSDWDTAVKSAANKLITAYNSFDETAPDSVYEAAGKEPPEEERALGFTRLFAQVDAAVYELDGWPWLHDVYLDDEGGMSAIVSSAGKLYRVPVMVSEDETVTLGEMEQVTEEFTPVAQRTRTAIVRQADGRVRWVSVSCTSVLNRVGEIDTTALFDSFVAHAEETGDWPYRCFYHLGEAWRTGQVDMMAREGNVLITSGLYDENNVLAEAEIAALERDEDGYWGESIHYDPAKPPSEVEIADGVNVRAYEAGKMIEVSVLPELEAAAYFTVVSVSRRADMRQNVLDALVDLFGDEERALAFAEGVDETNRGITDEGLIARAKAEVEGEAEPDAEPVEAAGDPDAEPGEGEPEPTRELELDDAAMDAITGRFAEMLEPFTERIDSLSAQLGELTEAQTGAEERAESTRESLNLRLKRLERTDEEKHTEWAADLPRAQKLRVTYRPREANEDRADGEPDSLADVANATLEKMPRY